MNIIKREDANKIFLGGSNPSVLPFINDESSLNLMMIDGVLSPSHGLSTTASHTFIDTIYKVNKSNKNQNVYVISGSELFRFSSNNVVEELGTLGVTQKYYTMSENLNNEIGITTGSAYYVLDYASGEAPELIGSDQGLKIKNPSSSAMIDDFIFIGGQSDVTFQVSKPNNAKDFTNNVTIPFESKASKLMAFGVIDKALFAVGDNHIERFVVIGGDQVVQRDNNFTKQYGLYDRNSFVSKLNMICGLFTSQYGGFSIRFMDENSQTLQEIENPGLVKKMIANGDVSNADIYQIDGHTYYEISFKDYSYVYCFNTGVWHEKTSPFTQVFYYKDISYATNNNSIYAITEYKNSETKVRQIPPFSNDFSPFTIGQIRLWYTNKNFEKGNVRFVSTSNMVTYSTTTEYEICGELPFDALSFVPDENVYQYSFSIQTKLNVIWRGMTLEEAA